MSTATVAPEEQLNRIVGLIYSAPLTPQHWPKLLSELASYFDAFGTQLNVFDYGVDRPYFTITHGCEWLTPERIKRYIELTPSDPRMPYSYAHLGMPSHCRQACDEEALHASDIYKELLGPGDAEYAMAVMMPDQSRIISLGAMRRKSMGPFNQSDCGKMGLLIPHLRRAVRAQALLSQSAYTQQLASVVFDSMTVGALLVTAKMETLFANPLATRTLAALTGRLNPTETLSLSSSEANSELRLAVNRIVSNPPDAPIPTPITLEFQNGKDRPVKIVVTSIRDERAKPLLGNIVEPCALVLINDPDEPLESFDEQLQRLYGLTNAEIRLARHLLAGVGLAAQAAARELSHETTRTQLKSAFRKTRTSNQAELVRLLQNLPPWPESPPPRDGNYAGDEE